jgi:hypothetical protein
MRPFSASPANGEAKCYFLMPFLMTWAAAGDNCSTAITDAINQGTKDLIAALSEASLQQTQGEPAAVAQTVMAQTDCAAVVSHTATGAT